VVASFRALILNAETEAAEISNLDASRNRFCAILSLAEPAKQKTKAQPF
jgi:hypothetical protein